MTTRLALRNALIALAAAGSPGCSDDAVDAPALDLQLVPDINLNGVSQIASAIDTLRVIVDSPQGLYPPGSESVNGPVEVRDEDNDPSDLELVATVSVPSGRLPLLRIERGGLPDAPLDIRIIGHASADPSVRVAEGMVRGIRFDSNGVKDVPISFNIRPELLPPRVTEVQPADGTHLQPCRVDTIVVVFSRPILASTLVASGNFVVDRDPAPASIVVDGSGYIATYTAGAPLLAESFPYRITISTNVRSKDGIGLDQVAAEPGAQPYDANFGMSCDMQEPALDPVLCSPETGSDGTCPGQGRFACVEGACIPADCDQSSCAPSFVCNPATLRCEVDCRIYGEVEVCPTDRPACDVESGACVTGTR